MLTHPHTRTRRTGRDAGTKPSYSQADYGSRAEYEAARFRDGLIDGPVSPFSGPLEQAVWGTTPTPKRRPKEVSQGITAKEFWRLHRGVTRANLMGFVLNSFITITWSTVAVTDSQEVARCRSALLERLNKRMEARKMVHAIIWVDEVGTFFGHHTHILAHVDHFARRNVLAWIEEIVETVTGVAPVVKVPNVKGVVTTVDVKKLTDNLDSGQWRQFEYMMKGLLPDAATRLPFCRHRELILSDLLSRQLEFQGEISGHRCGLTHFLGRSQERRYLESLGTILDNWYEQCLGWLEVADPDLGVSIQGPSLFGDSFFKEGVRARSAASLNRELGRLHADLFPSIAG